MPTIHRKLVLVCLLCGLVAPEALAQPGRGPVYARSRTRSLGGPLWNQGVWNQGTWQSDRYARHRYPGPIYGRPLYGGQPMITGSWYARPVPTHLDYDRLRYSDDRLRYGGTLQAEGPVYVPVPAPQPTQHEVYQQQQSE